jgi:hypothetical protein
LVSANIVGPGGYKSRGQAKMVFEDRLLLDVVETVLAAQLQFFKMNS